MLLIVFYIIFVILRQNFVLFYNGNYLQFKDECTPRATNIFNKTLNLSNSLITRGAEHSWISREIIISKWSIPQFLIKGTESVISSDPPWKDVNVLICLKKYELDVFCFFKAVIFYLRFLYESDLCISCLKEAMEKLKEINTFRVRKPTVSSTFLIRLRF